MVKKVQISIDEELLERIDNYADDTYISRSALIALATKQYLITADVSRAIVDASIAFRKIADSGKVDSQTLEQLADIERVIKLFAGTSTK